MIYMLNDYDYIVITDHGYINGGLAKVVVSQILELSIGRNKKILLVTGSKKLAPELSNNNVDHLVIGKGDYLTRSNSVDGALNGIFDLSVALKLRKILKACITDDTKVLVHGWSKSLSPSIFLSLRSYTDRTFYWNHDYFMHCPNGGFFDYKIKKSCKESAVSFRCLVRNCDSRSYLIKVWRILRFFAFRLARGKCSEIAVTNASLNVINEFSYFESISVINNPIDLIKKDRIHSEKNDYVVVVGRPSPEKGVAELLELLSKIDFRRKIVVIGAEESDFGNKKLQNLNLECCGWLGRHDVEKIMAKARYLFFPSLWYETQGLVVTEAIAMGVPVICANVNCGMEALGKYKAGMLYDPYELDSLSETIKLFESNDNVKSCSERGYRLYWSMPENINRHVDQVVKICQ
ncbi:polysaccharide biosynthesis protein [Amphritea balenae]|nr:polysaccharide biosynthesis protein [Amphritea balenae]